MESCTPNFRQGVEGAIVKTLDDDARDLATVHSYCFAGSLVLEYNVTIAGAAADVTKAAASKEALTKAWGTKEAAAAALQAGGFAAPPVLDVHAPLVEEPPTSTETPPFGDEAIQTKPPPSNASAASFVTNVTIEMLGSTTCHTARADDPYPGTCFEIAQHLLEQVRLFPLPFPPAPPPPPPPPPPLQTTPRGQRPRQHSPGAASSRARWKPGPRLPREQPPPSWTVREDSGGANVRVFSLDT